MAGLDKSKKNKGYEKCFKGIHIIVLFRYKIKEKQINNALISKNLKIFIY